MAIPAMALLQQHNARRDIVTALDERRHAAIEARGHSELGAQSCRKNPPNFSNVYQTTVRTTDMIPWHKTSHNITPSLFFKFHNYMTEFQSATYKKNLF